MRIEIMDVETVINVIEADETFAEQNYQGAWRVAQQQGEPVPSLPAHRMTRLAFRNRFSPAEKTGIELASLDDPAAPLPQRAQAAAVRVYLADVAAATNIDPQHTETRASVQALEAAGLIGAGRALQILDAPIQAPEAFTGQE